MPCTERHASTSCIFQTAGVNLGRTKVLAQKTMKAPDWSKCTGCLAFVYIVVWKQHKKRVPRHTQHGCRLSTRGLPDEQKYILKKKRREEGKIHYSSSSNPLAIRTWQWCTDLLLTFSNLLFHSCTSCQVYLHFSSLFGYYLFTCVVCHPYIFFLFTNTLSLLTWQMQYA